MTVPVILEQWLQAEHQPDSPRDHREVHHQLDISLGMSGLFRTSDGCSSVLLASADFVFWSSILETLPIAQGLAGEQSFRTLHDGVFKASHIP